MKRRHSRRRFQFSRKAVSINDNKKRINISVECLRRLTYLQSNLMKPTNCKCARNILAGRTKARAANIFQMKSHREITKFVKTIVVKPGPKENCAQRIYVTT